MDAFGEVMAGKNDDVKIPDLDWLKLEDKNVPSENNVEVIPELQDEWSHRQDRNTALVPLNMPAEGESKEQKKEKEKKTKEAVGDMVKQATKDLMLGIHGKELTSKLAGLYPQDLILAGKEALVRVASEQGLLGKVYIDLSPFTSCREASKVLGKNRIRLAKYVLDDPSRSVCACNAGGHCRNLNKKVVASMEYTPELLEEYTNHLRVAGFIGEDEEITSKEGLQEALTRLPEKGPEPVEDNQDTEEEEFDAEKFAREMEQRKELSEKQAAEQRFYEARPILAYVQDQMLRGKSGDALKDSVLAKFAAEDVHEYASEIAKVASLQGLMGNLYVDVSLYRNPEEAIKSIRTASTNPVYLVQSRKASEFDDTLVRVAMATGCTEFPRNGKIDTKIASSYVEDLKFTNRIASDIASDLHGKIASGDNVLSVIKEAYLASQEYVPEVKTGGVEATVAPVYSKQAEDVTPYRSKVRRAVEAGIAVRDIEEKLASVIPVGEAYGMVRDVIASVDLVDADTLTNCESEKYQLKSSATIAESEKCASCIFRSPNACAKQSVRFAGKKDPTEEYFDLEESLDEKMKKVQLKENPDQDREDIKQKYDMSEDFGSGMNVALDKLRGKKAGDADIDHVGSGIDTFL